MDNMAINTEQYQRITRFLDADMTLEEMDTFKQELDANPAMRQQLNFEQSVRDGFALDKNNIIAGGKTNAVTPLKKLNTRRWLTIAAAATVTGIILALLFFNTKKDSPAIVIQHNDSATINKKDTAPLVINKPADSSNKKNITALYKQYFTADTIPQNYPMYLAEALTNYQNEDYAAIEKIDLTNIPQIRGVEDKQAILNLGHYYKGIAYLKNNNTPQAIVNLQWVQNNCTDNSIKLNAQWYLALAYLKNNNAAEAINQLKNLTGKSTYRRYSREVKSLLKALEE
jgi:hypothetical protein